MYEKWRHFRCLDIDVIIVQWHDRQEDGVWVDVVYENRHTGAVYAPQNKYYDTIFFSKEKFKEWKFVGMFNGQ